MDSRFLTNPFYRDIFFTNRKYYVLWYSSNTPDRPIFIDIRNMTSLIIENDDEYLAIIEAMRRENFPAYSDIEEIERLNKEYRESRSSQPKS